MEKNEKKDYRNIVILTLLVIIFFMAVGYIKLTSNVISFNNGDKTNNDRWDVRFTNAYVDKKNSYNYSSNSINYSSLNATFDVTLNEPGSYITYIFEVTNKGTLDAARFGFNPLDVATLSVTNNGNPYLEYITYNFEKLEKSNFLGTGKKHHYKLTIRYLSDELYLGGNSYELPTQDITYNFRIHLVYVQA